MSAAKLAAQTRCLPFAHLLGLREEHNKSAKPATPAKKVQAARAAKPVVKTQADSTKELAKQMELASRFDQRQVTGLAASIIHAGKIRRREIAEKSELSPIAAAIIAAAKKARG